MKMRIFVAVLMLSAWASAGIVIGTVSAANCIPWSCQDVYPGDYEQIYNSGAFPGSMSISQISFFNTYENQGPTQGLAQMNYSIYLAITNQAVPDGTVPGGALLFASGALTGQNFPFGSTLTFTGTPLLL